MAIKSTIFKAELSISDMDRHYYENHQLTIARHPSETDERMMLRIAIFALHANELLSFTKGLSTDDEPDLWQKSLSDEIELWIELGQPDEKRVRKACGRSQQVYVYCYSTKSAIVWWEQVKNKFSRFENLKVRHIPEEVVEHLGQLVEKAMQLQCSIQDGVMWIRSGEKSVEVVVEHWN